MHRFDMLIQAYLLLRLITRTGPFGYDIFLGFGVGRKGKRNTGECGALSELSVLVNHKRNCRHLRSQFQR